MIIVSEDQIAIMNTEGQAAYPYECCGLMLGKFEDGHKRVTEIYPISNAREESAQRNRFLITPAELMRGELYARSHRLDVVGFYHSHPDEAAVPSQYDLEHAWPTYSYIVMAIAKGWSEDLRSWEMEADRSRFNEEEIVSEAGP